MILIHIKKVILLNFYYFQVTGLEREMHLGFKRFVTEHRKQDQDAVVPDLEFCFL